MTEPTRVLYAMTEYGEVYAEHWTDTQGRAWVAPCGTPTPDQRPDLAEAWIPDVKER